MFDVSTEATAGEFVSNKPLSANNLIHVSRQFIFDTFQHLVENEPAGAAARSFNITHKLQSRRV
jgi:hypothetical protein